MFLSRIELRSRRSGAEGIDPYKLHQLIWEALTSDSGATRPFLFRADVQSSNDAPPRIVCLVQSNIEADWNALKDILLDARQKPFEPQFTTGQHLQFFLRANPTRARKDINATKPQKAKDRAALQQRGKRVGLMDPMEQLSWLQRKAASGGFELLGSEPDGQMGRSVLIVGSRPWKWQSKGRSASHQGADFHGILRVTDPKLFLETLRAGIGPAKGFGFGLLSVARPKESQ